MAFQICGSFSAREPDALGVAAAFEIEDAAVAPAVLVVADQPALRVGGKRGLAGSGEAEEERDVARRARYSPSSAWETRRARAAGSSGS